jgi:penicillin-binding protein 1C
MPASPRRQARGLRTVEGTPDAPDHRLFGRWRRGTCKQMLRGVRCPTAGRWGRAWRAAASHRFKTGTSYGYRDAWSVGFSNDYTVGVWVGPRRRQPARRPCRARIRGAPILLKTFELLPPDVTPTIRRRPAPC